MNDNDLQQLADAAQNLTGDVDTAAVLEAQSEVFESLQEFTPVRRHAVRAAVLAAHGREGAPVSQEQAGVAVDALREAIGKLRVQIDRLRPLLNESLDGAISAAGEEGPIKTLVYHHGVRLGFARPQIDWIWNEIQQLRDQPIATVLPNGVDDLLTIIDAAAADEQILAAGFLRETGNADLDARARQVAVRFREHGITASVYHVLCLALIVTLFVAARDSDPQSAQILTLPAGGANALVDENILADESILGQRNES